MKFMVQPEPPLLIRVPGWIAVAALAGVRAEGISPARRPMAKLAAIVRFRRLIPN